MPVKKICEKTKRVCREHKKPLLLVLAIAVLTGVAERFGENLWAKRDKITPVYMNMPPMSEQKITCPHCQHEIRFRYRLTHTAVPIARYLNDIHIKE